MLATDPDADRLGVYVKDAKSGDYIPLTGNMSGSLLCEYVLSQKKAQWYRFRRTDRLSNPSLPPTWWTPCAKYYGVELVEVLTGFKYIGQQILKNETTGYGYVFIRHGGELRLSDRNLRPRQGRDFRHRGAVRGGRLL